TNAAGWALAQSGVYAPTGSGGVGDASSAAYDGTNIGLGYSYGGSFDYTNPNDVSVSDQQVGVSPVGQQSSVTLDPVETCDLWLTGPAVAAFQLAGCSPSGTTVPVLTGDPTVPRLAVEGTQVTGTLPGFTGATSTTTQWERCDSNGLNCVAIANSAGTTFYTPAALDADGSHTLRFEETATNAQGSSIAVSGPSEIVVSLTPTNVVLPTITGTLQSGQTLSAGNGTWDSSSPTSFTYRWQRCAATCSAIPGATASTYTLTASDVGTTLDAVVSATNTGGGTSATSAQTGTIAVAASSGGSSGGGSSGGSSGGGGGGSGKPDVALTVSASTTTPAVGSTMTLVYTVTDKNLAPATNLLVTLTLPSGVTYAGNYDPRGSGCSASSATTVVCNLAYVSSDTPATSVNVYLTVAATGPMTVAATATSDLGELSTTDNTVSVALNQSSSTTTSSATGIPTGLNGNPKTTTKKTDKTPPTAHAVASIAHRGRVADLRFKIYDNSGEAKAIATVKRNGKAIGKASTGFGPVAYGSVYYVGWMVPKKPAAGKYTFCVVAYDHANHHSSTSCAALAVH
ncbi:MAG TPA: hypothetical protein VHV52_03630, partial [Gaiellaceae bacterium]|nr:hypothetical protein [Gaiellaceae bacterium]